MQIKLQILEIDVIMSASKLNEKKNYTSFRLFNEYFLCIVFFSYFYLSVDLDPLNLLASTIKGLTHNYIFKFAKKNHGELKIFCLSIMCT